LSIDVFHNDLFFIFVITNIIIIIQKKPPIIYGIMKYIENIIFCIISIAYKSINLNGAVDYMFSNLFLDKSY